MLKGTKGIRYSAYLPADALMGAIVESDAQQCIRLDCDACLSCFNLYQERWQISHENWGIDHDPAYVRATWNHGQKLNKIGRALVAQFGGEHR